jgi:CheY-like chemotaxis protein
MTDDSPKEGLILFVDDEKICHTLVELIIPNFTSYELISAYNGKEALELAKRYSDRLSLILSDILLPDINGYEIYHSLQQDKDLKDIPFLFQSGLGSQEAELKKHIAAKVDIIYKPYKQTELLQKIAKAVDTS